MKVNGPARSGTTSLRRSSRSSASAGQSFQVDKAQGGGEPAQVAGPSALTAVDTLLALQEVEDPVAGRRQAVKRGHDMLDLLEDIRIGLIGGVVPLEKLKALIRMVDNRRQAFEDPSLSSLVDEIELRARVEIAKLEKVQEASR